jgi:class 3 adenylate cyclase
MTSENIQRDSERVYATVLFADISGFVAISEKLDPEEMTEFINGCFERLENVVFAHGGIVDKYIGDCLVAVFGLTPTTENAVSHAVRAGLDMRDALYQFNRDVRPPSPLDVHIGISSGPVIAGIMGSDIKRAFTVIGNTVNLAEYLEHASGKGQIFVGPQTYQETHAEFEYRPLPPVRPDGIGDPLPIYELVAVKSVRRMRRDSERRQATVMFADVIGFRSLAERMHPDELTRRMNECLAFVGAAVIQYGGVVDKYIGECVMALFGVPNAIENAPQQAINAAIEIRNRLVQFNDTQRLGEVLQLRVGINTGLVIAGDIGGRVKRDFTVMGDAVNLAARLKDAARPVSVIVGPETYRYTKDDFEFRPLPPLTVKGKEQPVQIYEVLSITERVHHTRVERTDRAIASALVGRTAELERITNQIRAAAGGRGGIVTIVGEAGIGKSRLVTEALQQTGGTNTLLLKARCHSLGQGMSFHPFIDLLHRWAGISDEEEETQAARRLEAAIAAVVPAEHVDEICPFIATMMGIRLSGAAGALVEGMDGSVLEKLIMKSTRELLQRLAAQQPLVLFFEDLHWADASSIRLLESLLGLAAGAPALFLLACRPDYADTGERLLRVVREQHAAQHEEIRVRPLAAVECTQLIDNLLQIDALPHSTRTLIARKAEGNPFYIEEVIRSLIDQGAVEYHDGRLRVTEKIDTVIIPGTVQEVIMARVDQLDEATRHLLQTAAVIGRSFHHRIIAAIVEDDGVGEAQLAERLAYLKSRQLLFERRSRRTARVRRRTLLDELEYVFQHALVQETIYQSILQKTRRGLHLKVAETIERIFFYRLADFYGMLAYHYSHAEQTQKAEEYLFKAGDEAARAAASSEALHFFREASRLYLLMHGAGGDPYKKALLEKNIALALLNRGDHSESIEHFDCAAEHLGQPVGRGAVAASLAFSGNLLGLLAQLYLRLGRHRKVTAWEAERLRCEILFNRARAQIYSDPRRLFFDSVAALRYFNEIDVQQIDQASVIYASGAGMFFYSGVSFAVGRRILAIAKQLMRPGNIKDAFTCASMEFICQYLEGDWGDTHVAVPSLVEEATRHGQLWDVNTYLGLLCDRKLRQGDFDGARGLLEQLGDINDAYGYAFAGANRDGMHALLLLEERELDHALQVAGAYHAARHEDLLKVLGLGTCAKIQVLRGDLDDAAAALAAAEKITRRSREIPPWHLSAYAAARLRYDVTLVERALLRRGTRLGELRRRARQSARYARHIAAKVALQRTEIHQLVGHLCWLTGRRRDALRYWHTSVAVGTQLRALPELARTYALAGRCLAQAGGTRLRLGDLDAAGCRARAGALFAEMGLVHEADATRLVARAA